MNTDLTAPESAVLCFCSPSAIEPLGFFGRWFNRSSHNFLFVTMNKFVKMIWHHPLLTLLISLRFGLKLKKLYNYKQYYFFFMFNFRKCFFFNNISELRKKCTVCIMIREKQWSCECNSILDQCNSSLWRLSIVSTYHFIRNHFRVNIHNKELILILIVAWLPETEDCSVHTRVCPREFKSIFDIGSVRSSCYWTKMLLSIILKAKVSEQKCFMSSSQFCQSMVNAYMYANEFF